HEPAGTLVYRRQFRPMPHLLQVSRPADKGLRGRPDRKKAALKAAFDCACRLKQVSVEWSHGHAASTTCSLSPQGRGWGEGVYERAVRSPSPPPSPRWEGGVPPCRK